MKIMHPSSFDPQLVVDELLNGSGAVRFPRLFNEEQVAEAREIIIDKTHYSKLTGSHFNKGESEKAKFF